MKKTTKKSNKKQNAWLETKKMLKKGIIRPHFNRIIRRGGKAYYYTEMTTGAGTHSGPLLPKSFVDEVLR